MALYDAPAQPRWRWRSRGISTARPAHRFPRLRCFVAARIMPRWAFPLGFCSVRPERENAPPPAHHSDVQNYGALPALGEKWLAPQGPTDCAPSALLMVNIAYYGVGGEHARIIPASYQVRMKPSCGHNQDRRQQHYNPPIMDSAQSPHMALGRT